MSIKTILIIEDNESDKFLDQIIIEAVKPGIKILHAVDGVDALKILSESPESPDLILLDINMPRMNGHEFLEEFSNNNKKDIPVVVMLTSSGQEQDKEKALAYKCVKDYLLKPLDAKNVEEFDALVKQAAAMD